MCWKGPKIAYLYLPESRIQFFNVILFKREEKGDVGQVLPDEGDARHQGIRTPLGIDRDSAGGLISTAAPRSSSFHRRPSPNTHAQVGCSRSARAVPTGLRIRWPGWPNPTLAILPGLPLRIMANKVNLTKFIEIREKLSTADRDDRRSRFGALELRLESRHVGNVRFTKKGGKGHPLAKRTGNGELG